MRLLLDAHTFIWWDNDLPKLSPHALALCRDPAISMLFSIASAWEMQIKIQLGKLRLLSPFAAMIDGQQRRNILEVLPVDLTHVLALERLPIHHKDPFDRILIAQAIEENAVLISKDEVFGQYSVNVER